MGMKKILGLLFVVLSFPVYAANFFCPTVLEIQQSHYRDWLPLYIDGEELISDKDLAAYKAHIQQFVVAKWDDAYLENAHCFYEGNDPILNKVILAHDAWRPEQTEHWHWRVRDKQAECDSKEVKECTFVS